MNRLEETKQLFKKVMARGEVPDRVPLFLNLAGWIIYQGNGYGYTESVYDGDKILYSYEKAIQEYPADMYYDMGTYSSMFFSRCLGSEDYYLNDEAYSLSFKDISYLTDREGYMALAEDPANFLWNHFYRNKFKNLSPDKLKETLKEYLSLAETHYGKSEALKRSIEEKSGALFLTDVPMYQPAFDYLFQYIVGIKGISLDMRRKKKELLCALDALERQFTAYGDKLTPALDMSMPFQSQICLLSHTITNKAQFEQFIWPHLKAKLDDYIEHGHRFYFTVEGAGGPLLDFLDYIPDGLCALHIEKEDLSDLKERYGDKFTYAGGMPTEVLGNASLDECRRYTSKVLEQYGHSGNFIFAADKMITFQRDVKPDNLKAVCETVLSFKP